MHKFKRTELNPIWQFYLIVIILIGGDILIISSWDFFLKPSTNSFITAIGTSLAAIIPTLATIWVFAYNLRARMEARESIRKVRQEHYDYLRKSFFSRDFRKNPEIYGTDAQLTWPSEFLLQTKTFDYKLMKDSPQYENALKHIEEDFGVEDKSIIINAEEKAISHNKQSREVDVYLRETILKNGKRLSIKLIDAGKDVGDTPFPYVFESSISKIVTRAWNEALRDGPKFADVLTTSLENAVSFENGWIKSNGDSLGRMLQNDLEYLKLVQNLIEETIRNTIIFSKVKELYLERQVNEHNCDKVTKDLSNIDNRISDHNYTTVTECCPYPDIYV